MSSHAFDAYVVAAAFVGRRAAFALGDGTVRFESGETVQAHDGAVLCAAAHPSDTGLLTGGDDGRLVWSTPSGSVLVGQVPGRWIDAVAASPATGLIAFSAGRDVQVRDIADPRFSRCFRHERTVSDLAFDPKGRRIASATYGGAVLWYARIAEQTPQALRWAGSHIGVIWSPDGKFLVTSLQEGAVHGWRLADRKDLRMDGYPAKVKSMVFLANGSILATSGADAAILWPFLGANGPMGQQAVELGYDAVARVVRVTGSLSGRRLAAGLSDGRIWSADLEGLGVTTLRPATGSPISALAASPDGAHLAWGDEQGAAGVMQL